MYYYIVYYTYIHSSLCGTVSPAASVAHIVLNLPAHNNPFKLMVRRSVVLAAEACRINRTRDAALSKHPATGATLSQCVCMSCVLHLTALYFVSGPRPSDTAATSSETGTGMALAFSVQNVWGEETKQKKIAQNTQQNAKQMRTLQLVGCIVVLSGFSSNSWIGVGTFTNGNTHLYALSICVNQLKIF